MMKFSNKMSGGNSCYKEKYSRTRQWKPEARRMRGMAVLDGAVKESSLRWPENGDWHWFVMGWPWKKGFQVEGTTNLRLKQEDIWNVQGRAERSPGDDVERVRRWGWAKADHTGPRRPWWRFWVGFWVSWKPFKDFEQEGDIMRCLIPKRGPAAIEKWR